MANAAYAECVCVDDCHSALQNVPGREVPHLHYPGSKAMYQLSHCTAPYLRAVSREAGMIKTGSLLLPFGHGERYSLLPVHDHLLCLLRLASSFGKTYPTASHGSILEVFRSLSFELVLEVESVLPAV